jgi:hypothetical protein
MGANAALGQQTLGKLRHRQVRLPLDRSNKEVQMVRQWAFAGRAPGLACRRLTLFSRARRPADR